MNENFDKKKPLSIIIAAIVMLLTAFNIIPESEAPKAPSVQTVQEVQEESSLFFRNEEYLTEHYDKHGIEMGFESAKDYEKAASDVVNNEQALHKLEAEDGDDIYYLEETNEFVIVSKDGYIRTYFKPDRGKRYYDSK